MDAARSHYERILTMGELALRRLSSLRAASGCVLRDDACETLQLLLGSAFHRALDAEPSWSTDVTDDGTPFEFSVALDSTGTPELRVLAERQEAPFDLHSNWAAGLQLQQHLRARGAIDTTRFDAISAVFAPDGVASKRAEFAIWHAANLSLAGAGSAAYKVYLNPQIRGPERARGLVREALARLGLTDAWRFIDARLALPDVRILFFALDLADSSEARVKIYLAHDTCMVRNVEHALEGTHDYVPGEATAWIETLLDSHGPFDARPIITSYAFTSRSPAVAQATLHVPIRCYLSNDDEALDRALGLVRELGIAVESGFAAGIETWAGRPLHVGRGMLTYVSCRRAEQGVRATFYLAPQLYAISSTRTARKLPRPRRDSHIRELAPETHTMHVVQERIEQHTSELRQHSFLQRLLDGEQSLASVQALARRLTFFVLVFQDMLRLTAKRMTHPVLAAMARTHQQEDKGHDIWFLSDLKGLRAEPELKELFSDQHEVSRDVAYELLSLLLRSRDDRARMAVLMVMETAGAEFFPRIVACLEKLGRADDLIFFGRHHMQAEARHTSAEPEQRDQLWQLQLEPEVVPEVLAAVDDAFGAMTRLAGALASSM
jgi:DMATS type aromatic prenyltransferase